MFKIDTKDIPYEMFEFYADNNRIREVSIQSKECYKKNWNIPFEAIHFGKIYTQIGTINISEYDIEDFLKEYPKETRKMIDKHPQRIEMLKTIKRREIEKYGLDDLDYIINDFPETSKNNIKKLLEELILAEIEKL